MKTQVYRYLRGYTLDPSFSTLLDTFLINQTVYKIRWEPTEPGPIGEYFEVIDYDPASRCFYEPVNLHEENLLASNGLKPSEGNPKFHQQFVYTIAMKTLEHFEEALGRKVVWHRRHHVENGEHLYSYVDRLRIYPHGLREANAYYFPDKKALLFGYFKASLHTNGINMPGGTVFTCLSPDIVAHEVTHAILESIHPRFNEDTNLDVPAFHEAFADIIALLQRFMIVDLLEHQMTASQGRLEGPTILGELATQFGNSVGHGALRSAIGKKDKDSNTWVKLEPNPTDYKEILEAHERGAILVAAFFDAFIRVYNFKTRDLFELAKYTPDSPILIKRLAREASEIAHHLLQIAIQALDYCPPLDISFGDYLRGLITADMDMVPSDEFGYRIALIEAFRARGIFPDRVNVMSVESLVWNNPINFTREENKILTQIRNMARGKIRAFLEIEKRKELYEASRELGERVHNILMETRDDIRRNGKDPTQWNAFLEKLGLAFFNKTFRYGEREYSSELPHKIEVHQVRPAFRYTREGRRIEQMIVTLTQKLTFTEKETGHEVIFRGGSTIIFNLDNPDNAVEYVIFKNINSERRFNQQLAYQSGELTGMLPLADTLYDEESGQLNLSFKALHQH